VVEQPKLAAISTSSLGPSLRAVIRAGCPSGISFMRQEGASVKARSAT
jgi:hypothetical protein